MHRIPLREFVHINHMYIHIFQEQYTIHILYLPHTIYYILGKLVICVFSKVGRT